MHSHSKPSRPTLRRFRVGSSLLAIFLLISPPGRASSAWEDGKAYTAMLANAGADTVKKVADAVNNLKKAQDALVAAQNALLGAGAASTTAASVVSDAQLAVNIAQGAVDTAAAGAPWVVGAVAAAAGGTLIGQGLRGLWSACWDPVCSLHFSGSVPQFYTPVLPGQVSTILPTLTSQATGGAISLSAADFSALGTEGDAAEAFIAQGAALMENTAQGAAFAAAGNTAQLGVAAISLTSQLASYRSAVANFAAFLPSAGLTSPVAGVAAAQATFTAKVAAARAACNPAAGDDCVALNKALDAALAAFAQATAAVNASQYGPLTGGASAYIPDLTSPEFGAFLASCAANGSACLPAAEINLAQLLIAGSGTIFDIAPAIASYDALGDTGGREAALFNNGSIDLPTLLLDSATVQSNCGGPNCTWLLIDPQNSALVAEPPGWLVLVIAGLGLVLSRRRFDPAPSVSGVF